MARDIEPVTVTALADVARTVMHLRHGPLLLFEVLSRTAGACPWCACS
nr:hypothetical protein CDS [Bradyrhizobium sp.]